MLLPFLILACVGFWFYAGAMMVSERKASGNDQPKPIPVIHYLLASGFPTLVAINMTYLFILVGGATTVQFNVGSSSAMNVWSTWVRLWPQFMLCSLMNGVGALIWIIVCATKRTQRRSMSLAFASLLLSLLTFLTVASFFPSA